MNIEISQIYWILNIWLYMNICVLEQDIFLLETMISYIWLWTNWLWINSDTQTNGGRSLVFWYPNQWGSFIGILIPKPMGVIHWYSDTQTNGGYSLVLWYPNQWGLFIGILIPKPIGFVHWYFDGQSRGYSVTIVIRLLIIWITFEYLIILSH